MSYEIALHSHRFAVWTANRAASRGVRGLNGRIGQKILEACGFNETFSTPSQLPDPSSIDAAHRKWRHIAIDRASDDQCDIRHGVAAKLINIYLKSRFVCAGFHHDTKVDALHPPIDRRLLDGLAKANFGGNAPFWRKRRNDGWRSLESDEYEALIDEIRRHLNGRPLWAIEEYWSPTS